MARAILIPQDPSMAISEVEVEIKYPGLNHALGVELIERVTTQILHDRFTDLDGTAVMIVDEEGRVNGKWGYNERATCLYVPASYRLSNFIAGDALIVGEAMTEDGPDFVSLPERIGAGDIIDLVERNERV